jgi:hypothetical protein
MLKPGMMSERWRVADLSLLTKVVYQPETNISRTCGVLSERGLIDDKKAGSMKSGMNMWNVAGCSIRFHPTRD